MDTIRLVLSTMLIGFVVGGLSLAQAQEKQASESATLAQELQEHDELSTLVSVAKAADMKKTLASERNYTVLAPTDDALSEKEVKSMSKSEKQTLLRNHLLDGTYPVEKVAKMEKVKTLEGSTVSVEKKEDGIKIGDGMVVKKDVEASNGVIHAVDSLVVSTDDSEKKGK